MPAARAADCLFMLPAFPPLAERCALIELESMDKIYAVLAAAGERFEDRLPCPAMSRSTTRDRRGDRRSGDSDGAVRRDTRRRHNAGRPICGLPRRWHGNHNDRAFLMVGVPA